MYLAPMEITKHCNKCPFGFCHYSYPLWRDERFHEKDIDKIDSKENKAGTYGYVCNVEFQNSKKYTKVLRADVGKDIKKPKWCGLREVGENANPAN